MPSKPLDEVIIHLDGKEHSHWLDYRITSDLLAPCDAWQVKVAIPGARPASLKPWADIQVTMNRDPVLVGRIDAVRLRTVKQNREMELRGRDLMAVLVDCSAPIYFAEDLSLEEIAAKLARPLGISKIVVQAFSGKARASVQPGMRVWDALQEACEAAGLWPWFEPDGTLVIGGPDYDAPPVADLILRFDGQDNNLIDLQVEHDISKQYSEVTVLGQAAGSGGGGRVVGPDAGYDNGQWTQNKGQHALKAAAQDEKLIKAGINRPLISVDSNCSNQAEGYRKAQKLLADGQMAALTITATVRGHRTDDGKLWTPGQRVNLISEPDWINAAFFLTARTFSGGSGGQRTELVLKPDKTWLPELAVPNKSKSPSGSGRVVTPN